MIARLSFSLLQRVSIRYASDMNTVDLRQFEARVFSQNGEDGVIQKLLACVQPTSVADKTCVEIGTQDGTQCNTRCLTEKHGWSGILIDGAYEDPAINLHKRFITRENVVDILHELHVPEQFAVLSIDIDYNTFHVLNAILRAYKPTIIVTEYNRRHKANEDRVVVYDPDGVWDHKTWYFGGSLLAFKRMCAKYGYVLAYADKSATNAFFVRDELRTSHFANEGYVEKFGCGLPCHRKDVANRPFVTSYEAQVL